MFLHLKYKYSVNPFPSQTTSYKSTKNESYNSEFTAAFSLKPSEFFVLFFVRQVFLLLSVRFIPRFPTYIEHFLFPYVCDKLMYFLSCMSPKSQTEFEFGIFLFVFFGEIVVIVGRRSISCYQ